MRRPLLTAALASIALTGLPAFAAPADARLPHRWPHHFQLGVADQPGGAAALRARAPFGFRYQYLTGGVNTGHGWATWNPHGTFVTRYIAESRRARIVPVFTYYQLLDSSRAAGDESTRDRAALHDAPTMRAYWRDFALFLRRAHGRGLVVAHMEPDLWGYLEQAGEARAARAFARRAVALRDRYARNVVLAWHLSIWGTNENPTYSRPSLRHMRALAERSAAFWRRGGGPAMGPVFVDVEDRDAGYNEVVEHDPHTAWGPADFRRLDVYLRAFHRRTRRPLVVWQIPLGNSTLPNTWGRFRDSRVQWWLGRRSHLRAIRDAGVVALLFGGGAPGTTSPATDGGLFFALARRCYARPLAR